MNPINILPGKQQQKLLNVSNNILFADIHLPCANWFTM